MIVALRQTADVFTIDLLGRGHADRLTALRLIGEDDERVLATLAKGAGRIVEVGTYTGASARIFLDAMAPDGTVVCVDDFDMGHAPVMNASASLILACLLARLEGDRHRTTVMMVSSLTAAALLRPTNADLVFLDAGHGYEAVQADIQAWLPHVRPGGLIVGHDFDKEGLALPWETVVETSEKESGPDGIHCGVIRAVSEAFGTFTLPEGENSIWVARPEDTKEV